jgi:hypothetical protein
MDVLTVRVEETGGRETPVTLGLVLPENARLGSRVVSVGNRTVLALPGDAPMSREPRPWGWDDDATSLPGWAKPGVPCDPGFANIRAGLGGVPICYRFRVAPKTAANVVLGICESHWAEPGKRPFICSVEGAPPEEVDPIARWGQHQPGAVHFEGRDENGDGYLEVSALPKLGAPDLNPILNVVWVFPAGPGLKLDQVLAGRMNAAALHYVDAGGQHDQSLYAPGMLQYALTLPPKGNRELHFLAACRNGSLPSPDDTTWTPEKLRRAAAEVWRDWPGP